MESGRGGGWQNPGFMSPPNLQRLLSGQMQGGGGALPPGTSTDYRGNSGAGGTIDDVGKMALQILQSRAMGGGGVPPQVPQMPSLPPAIANLMNPLGTPNNRSTLPPAIDALMTGNTPQGGVPSPGLGSGNGVGMGNPQFSGAGGPMSNNRQAPSQVLMMLMELFRRNQQKRQQQMLAQKMGRPF
jgi:hypothetical protein